MPAITAIQNVVALRCPKCHKGHLFTHSNPYNLSYLADMPDNCAVCGESFRREPGFYFGAMYVSYALTIVLSVVVFAAMYLFGLMDWKRYLVVNALMILVLFPLVFRWSRAVWLAIFV